MKKKYIFYFFLIIILIFAALNLNYYIKFSSPQFGFEKGKLKGIKGVVIQDSTPASFKTQSVLIKLKSCINFNGDVATASGIMRCSYKGDNLFSGDLVTFYGKFSLYGFSVKSLSYRQGRGNQIRALILSSLSNRLGSSEEANLIRMLLLGFSLEGESELKEMARRSGVSHVLALSGMHLVFFSTLISYLFYPIFKKDSKYLALLFLFIYVLIIGPKPSLIRAIIFKVVSLCFKKRNSLLLLLITFSLQSCFFLSTIGELSTIYSYTALLGILLFAPIFDYLTPRFKPLIIYFSTSYSALIFTAFVSLKYFNAFYLGGIIISGILTPLLFIIMALGILALFNSEALNLITPLLTLFKKVMEVGRRCIKVESFKGYLIFLIPILCILLLFCILKLYVEPKLRKS